MFDKWEIVIILKLINLLKANVLPKKLLSSQKVELLIPSTIKIKLNWIQPITSPNKLMTTPIKITYLALIFQKLKCRLWIMKKMRKIEEFLIFCQFSNINTMGMPNNNRMKKTCFSKINFRILMKTTLKILMLKMKLFVGKWWNTMPSKTANNFIFTSTANTEPSLFKCHKIKRLKI